MVDRCTPRHRDVEKSAAEKADVRQNQLQNQNNLIACACVCHCKLEVEIWLLYFPENTKVKSKKKDFVAWDDK